MKKNKEFIYTCKGRSVEQNNTSSFDEEIISKFKKYHRDGEIEFAIAELEKIKKLCFKNYIVYGYIPQSVLKEHIEQQIKELKGKKNG